MFPFRSSSVFLARKQTLISGNHILPANKWRFDPHCEPFATLESHATLHLPSSVLGTDMAPAAQVFCKLPFKRLTGSKMHHPPEFYKRFKIEETMKTMGFTYGSQLDPFVLDLNETILRRLDASARGGAETKVDYLAEALLKICGFDDGTFEITGMDKQRFDLFGRQCGAVPDHTVILSPKGDLVLVCEDKQKVKKTDFVGKQGHLGQIMCELLQILSLNLKAKHPVIRNVFALRMINYHVACFRIDPIEDTLKKLVNVKTKTTPTFSDGAKLTLLCNVENPEKRYGYSLIKPTERTKACQLLTDIRSFILV